jgi:hydroxymethylglutaryl-CoA synthase
MTHVYDFYKPDMSSEYPAVDAPLSIQCYLSSLDTCYTRYRSKASSSNATGARKALINLDAFNAVLFNTPNCNLVQKSLARLAVNDFVSLEKEARQGLDHLKQFADIQLEKTYFDRDVEKAFMSHSLKQFETKTKPSLYCATNIGNMYTPSLYGGLVSHLVVNSASTLAGQRVALFSYGSGLASTFFSIRISEDESKLAPLLSVLSDVKSRLETRAKLAPTEFESTLMVREKAVHASPYSPAGPVDNMFPGTWYLESIDDKHRRQYSRTPAPAVNGH